MSTQKSKDPNDSGAFIHSNDPLFGKTLQSILIYLVAEYGFEELGKEIKINSFTTNPSITSSLRFLRKTPWARQKVEELYIITIKGVHKRV